MKTLTAMVMMVAAVALGAKAQAQPQAQSGGYRLPVTVIGKDTLPVYVMEDVQVEEKLDAESIEKQRQWLRLMQDVQIVYPYAETCAAKLKEINEQMVHLEKNKEKKQLLKAEEQKLKEEFEGKLRNLNKRQGKLLIKLIDRQTGETSYSLIKEYKSGFTAVVWQSFASMYGMSLKDRYDPAKEEEIELMIRYLGFK